MEHELLDLVPRQSREAASFADAVAAEDSLDSLGRHSTGSLVIGDRRHLSLIGPPPCEVDGGCAHRDHCASRREACHAFFQYVESGAWDSEGRVPSRREYARIYRE